MPKSARKAKLQAKSPEAQKYHQQVFLPRIEEVRKTVESIALTILVWGPGESHELYPLRIEMINALRKANFDAETSENLVGETDVWSDRSQEMMQALAADLIVILCVSPGAIAEMADFSNRREIARKMIVFLDEKHKAGYVSSGPARDLSVVGHVHWYTSHDDLYSGKLIRVALHHAKQYQLASFLQSRAV